MTSLELTDVLVGMCAESGASNRVPIDYFGTNLADLVVLASRSGRGGVNLSMRQTDERVFMDFACFGGGRAEVDLGGGAVAQKCDGIISHNVMDSEQVGRRMDVAASLSQVWVVLVAEDRD